MVKALKEKDVELMNSLRKARLKTKKVKDQLNKFEEITELNKVYQEEVESLKNQVDVINAENQQLQTNFLGLTELHKKEKAQHDKDIDKITHTMEEIEKYQEDHLSQSVKKLDGKQ